MEHLRNQSIGALAMKDMSEDEAQISGMNPGVDMEVFTTEHENWLLTEAGPEVQANGKSVDFRPCSRGEHFCDLIEQIAG